MDHPMGQPKGVWKETLGTKKLALGRSHRGCGGKRSRRVVHHPFPIKKDKRNLQLTTIE